MSSAEVRKIVKEKKIYYGADITIRMLKTGKVGEVFVASNCHMKAHRNIFH